MAGIIHGVSGQLLPREISMGGHQMLRFRPLPRG